MPIIKVNSRNFFNTLKKKEMILLYSYEMTYLGNIFLEIIDGILRRSTVVDRTGTSSIKIRIGFLH